MPRRCGPWRPSTALRRRENRRISGSAAENRPGGVDRGVLGLAIAVALEVALELLEVAAVGQPDDPADRRRHAEDDSGDAEEVARVGLSAAGDRLPQVDAGAGLGAADPRGDRARDGEDEPEPQRDDQQHQAEHAEYERAEGEPVG